eukprot:13557729-Alexandrium_andersonii.AAC.1
MAAAVSRDSRATRAELGCLGAGAGRHHAGRAAKEMARRPCGRLRRHVMELAMDGVARHAQRCRQACHHRQPPGARTAVPAAGDTLGRARSRRMGCGGARRSDGRFN